MFAAAHVVSTADGSGVDPEATSAVRERIWDLGLGVAEVMDTAQRGQGLTTEDAHRIAARTAHRAAERRAEGRPAELVIGVSIDDVQLDARTLDGVVAAYERELAFTAGLDATPVLMCSGALASIARGADDYRRVYARLLAAADRPVVLHWLGEMFDPALAGYFSGGDAVLPEEVLADIVDAAPGRVLGVKVSVLDADRETALRRRLPVGVRTYTGDDFHYTDLIAGDDAGASDALLGAFNPLAPIVSEALARLHAGDTEGFRALLAPTEAFSRLVFEAPTRAYKTGITWVAYLRGEQKHFRMLGGAETARDADHLMRVLDAAEAIHLLPDPRLARARAAVALAGAASA